MRAVFDVVVHDGEVAAEPSKSFLLLFVTGSIYGTVTLVLGHVQQELERLEGRGAQAREGRGKGKGCEVTQFKHTEVESFDAWRTTQRTERRPTTEVTKSRWTKRGLVNTWFHTLPVGK